MHMTIDLLMDVSQPPSRVREPPVTVSRVTVRDAAHKRRRKNLE